MLTFKNVYLENLSQGHVEQHAQCFHSMANINVYKSCVRYCCANSRRFQDVNVQMFDLENLGQGHRLQRWRMSSSIKVVARFRR